jgi:hypothetical protein
MLKIQKNILGIFNSAIFVPFSGFLALTPLSDKRDFAKNLTEKEPGNLKFEVEAKRFHKDFHKKNSENENKFLL